MKIFVMVDMEGISGICQKSQVAVDGEHYQEGRRLLTGDVNACVEGCVQGGATQVVVRDCHGRGYHFNYAELDPRAEYIQGVSRGERMPDIKECDGVILLGYHAMAGTPQAILEHTMNSRNWQNFWMNGRKTGEIGIDAGIAGDHGVPTIMVSGDDKACREAKRFIKGVVTAQVKRGLDVEGGILLPVSTARELISRQAAKAVAKSKEIKPFKVKSPVTMRLELVSRGRLPVTSAAAKILDGRTYEVKAETVEAALQAL